MSTSIWNPEAQAFFDQVRIPRTRRIKVGTKAVEIPVPFPSPEDWRDKWIYFLLIDRFNNPVAPPRHSPWDGEHGEFQGGTFNGVRAQLDYLQELGVGAIWLSPVLKNCQYSPYTYHGYGIQDFLEIDPRFASDPEKAKAHPALVERELRDLVDEAHARGIYVIFDIVLNHSGDVFEYAGFGATAPWRDSPYPIYWRDNNGKAREDWAEAPAKPHADAAIWPEELCRNVFFRRQGEGGEAGGDFGSLKEMVTEFREFSSAHGLWYPVRDILIRAYQYLIARFDVDGFRIDTMKFIEPDFARVFANAIREFALSIGKKEFFTFGEVYDDEEKIARYIGRNAMEDSDLIGVDAALDFPLFYKLPRVVKGQAAPAEVINMFEHRKQVQRGIISSHGEASKFFVTFLDNHDQHQRFYYRDPNDPLRFDDQVTLAAGCLFALQGIPCLYYGTEQGLHGAGPTLEAVREALWGKPHAFDRQHPFYQAIQQIAATRNSQPALRYGRQYFRPLSGDGIHFGISYFPAGVLAFSRILSQQEVIVVANTNTQTGWNGEVMIDFALNPVNSTYCVLYSNKSEPASPGPVSEKPMGSVEIHEVNGAATHGPIRVVQVKLQPMEIQILGKSK
ncbi:MAG: alpha-amylase family glycosyl hydrolase [candidate division KSB1 bacterium]|nr:alpha-amylase family glycosyl hydrolase [candidate division KSB1 bacterium]MDZ7304058.1 alpha-amylase family glycosyl hydrolase [candidate division KSB1 bacterium]MDZ7313231.1 alpha-amylase family glycosyl hydrolase [candidate division KSB1 bacterium]